ncbi:MAG: CRISPR-associated endonuclease Cas3'', partial [Candidatus Anstonellales archaeon]
MSSLQLIDCLRAKSKKDEDNQINLLLKDHILETVKRAIEIKKTHDNNKEYIDYNMNEDFFKKLIKAAFLHDLGKIDYHFQKEVYSWEERQTDEFKVIKKFFDSHDSNITDHEFLSVLYSFLFNDSSDDMGEVRSAILLHHYNDYYNKKNPSINNFITDYPNSLEWLKFISSKQQEFKELVFSLREYVIDSLKDELVSKALNELDIDFNLINGIE